MGFRSVVSARNQNFIGIKDSSISHYKITFNKGPVVLRPHALVAEDGTITPLLIEKDGIDLGDWIRAYDIVRLNTGASSVRFCAKETEAVTRSPVLVLKNAIEAAIASGIAPSSWKNILPERDSNLNMEQFRRICMTFEKGCGLFLATVISVGGQPYEYANNITLVQITRPTGLSLFDKLSNAPDPTIFEDPDLAITIIPTPTRKEGMTITPNHYEVALVKAPPHLNKDLWNTHQTYILNNKLGWHNLLSIPSEKEQIGYIVSSSIPPSAVVYSLQEYRQLIPQNYWDMGERMLETEMRVQGRVVEQQTAPLPQYGISGGTTVITPPPSGAFTPPSTSAKFSAEEVDDVFPQAEQKQPEASQPETLSPEQLQAQINKLLAGRRKA